MNYMSVYRDKTYMFSVNSGLNSYDMRNSYHGKFLCIRKCSSQFVRFYYSRLFIFLHSCVIEIDRNWNTSSLLMGHNYKMYVIVYLYNSWLQLHPFHSQSIPRTLFLFSISVWWHDVQNLKRSLWILSFLSLIYIFNCSNCWIANKK